MSDDPFPGSSADFYERIIKLKEELEHLKTSHRAVMFQYLEARSLITELCDALQMRVWPNENPRLERSIDRKHKELLQRAREDTR